IFVKGEVIKTVPESKIVETLIEEAMKLAEQMDQDGAASDGGIVAGTPTVTVG
ncbi:flavodoxin-dependent (E)-4-hydroxy-3-methylbut-2-enyl-diphosphate synthase, partial [Streptomyces sp. NPDC004069]